MALNPNEKVPTREQWHEQIRKRYENAKTKKERKKECVFCVYLGLFSSKTCCTHLSAIISTI